MKASSPGPPVKTEVVAREADVDPEAAAQGTEFPWLPVAGITQLAGDSFPSGLKGGLAQQHMTINGSGSSANNTSTG